MQVGKIGLQGPGSRASQSLTGTDRSCTWLRTPSLRSRQLCRCRTQAQTAPSHSLQTVTFYGLDWVFRGPPRCYGGGGHWMELNHNERKRLCVLPPLLAPLLGRGARAPALAGTPLCNKLLVWEVPLGGLDSPALLWEWELGTVASSRPAPGRSRKVAVETAGRGLSRPARHRLVTHCAGAGRVSLRPDGAGTVGSEGDGAAGVVWGG